MSDSESGGPDSANVDIDLHPPDPLPPLAPFQGEGGAWRRRYEDLREEIRREEAERQVEKFVEQGKLCPAQAPFAEALLQAADTIVFDGEKRPLRQLLIAMIERQPPMALFSELAPSCGNAGDHSAQLLLPEEAEFYRRHFPDLSLDDIARRKNR